ncbi:MAG: PUA domain-containing protein [Candidatus Hermodarchaeota archaeon]
MEQGLLLTLRKIKAICDYQFGPLITDVLFDSDKDIHIEFSKNTGRMRHIYYQENLLLNFRPTNGFFTLSLFSAKKIIKSVPKPILRVIVEDQISDFIKKGRNVFCKHIIDIDDNLRALDEVIVVNQKDELLAIGKLMFPVPYLRSFKRGIGVNVRRGIDKSKN